MLFPLVTGFPGASASDPAEISFHPEPSLPYEPMFVSMSKITARAADAADLMIEFATLGEYGLEYVEQGRNGQDEHHVSRDCESRKRSGAGIQPSVRTKGRRSVPRDPTAPVGRRPVRNGSDRPGHPPSNRGRRDAASPPGRSSELPEALRPPRIELSWMKAA